DLLRMLGGDFLDLHAALGRGHHGDARGLAVDQHAEIELALDITALLDIDALHLAALGAGLLGDEHVAEHLGGVLADLLDRFDDAHAALALRIDLEAAGAAAAGMDLRLHHPPARRCRAPPFPPPAAYRRRRRAAPRRRISAAGFSPDIHGCSWLVSTLSAPAPRRAPSGIWRPERP